MFDFFFRRIYLVDHLEGLVDIHNHILPGIDDGSKSQEESIELIKYFSDFGVTDFICTPHIMHNYYDNTPKTVEDSFLKLKSALKEFNCQEINLDYAAEHMIDDNFEQILAQKEIIPLNKDHLLVEMSYLQPSINFDSSVEKIKRQQLFPVLAHPERYLYLKSSQQKYWEYKKSGVFFQLNLLALGGFYGKEVQKNSQQLIDYSMYDYVGSDVHKAYHLDALKNIKITNSLLNKVIPIVENTISVFSPKSN